MFEYLFACLFVCCGPKDQKVIEKFFFCWPLLFCYLLMAYSFTVFLYLLCMSFFLFIFALAAGGGWFKSQEYICMYLHVSVEKKIRVALIMKVYQCG